MDFIAPTDSASDVLFIVGVLLVASGLFAGLLSDRRWPRVTGSVLGVTLLVSSFLVAGATLREHREVVAERLGSYYRIHLTARDIQELRYPVSKPAASETIAFGAATLKVDGADDQVMLVWDGRKFALKADAVELERR